MGTHRFIHEAFYKTFLHIAQHSPTPMHVCWINPINMWNTSLSLAFNYPRKNGAGKIRGALGSSLVVASPKHSPWSEDPGFELLAEDMSSKYVFHDFVPPLFKKRLEKGDAVHWV